MKYKAWNFINKLINAYSKDKIPTLSAALAYYTLFAIAPMLLIIIAGVGKFLGEEAVKTQLINEISGSLGQSTAQFLSNVIGNISKPIEGTLMYFFSSILLLIGITGVFLEIQNGLNSIWNVDTLKKSWFYLLRDRFLSFLLVLGIGFLFFAFMMLSLVQMTMNTYLSQYLSEYSLLIGSLLQQFISYSAIIILFALMFKILPDVKINWKEVWIGAFITTILYALGKMLMEIYFNHSKIASLYGVSSSIIVLLIWVYYSAQIFFIGAEIIKILSLKRIKS
jgi:membrane protein